MKFATKQWLACLGLALMFSSASQAATEESARVIVRFKAQAPSVKLRALGANARESDVRQIVESRARSLGQRVGRNLIGARSLDERTHVMLASGISSAELAKRLAADGEVELVAVDHRRRASALPNDPLYVTGRGGLPAVGQWYLKPPGNGVASSVNAPAAWDLTTGSASVVVAVLDTGVRLDHPDLAGKLLPGYDMIGYAFPGSTEAIATANDGNAADGDASDPGDWVSQADITGGKLGSSCTVDDISNSSWHGTRVAGLIGAAGNNGRGIAGMAWGSMILPVRVLGKCGGYDSDILAGMKWAAGIAQPSVPTNPNPARVLNMSLGGGGSCAATDSTGALYRSVISDIMARGAVVVAAAGNSNGKAVDLPGNCPGVIAVTGLRHAGDKVAFSALGSEVTLSAPGGNCVNTSSSLPCLYPMLSLTNSGTTTPVAADDAYTDGQASYGTSFSAPIVAGTAALMFSVRPALTAAALTDLLKNTTRAFVKTGGVEGAPRCVAPGSAEQNECYCTLGTCGAGMLDAAMAVAAAAAPTGVTVQASNSASLYSGQSGTLTATASGLPAGRTVAGYSWVIMDDGGIVTAFSSGSNAATATVTPSGTGSFVARVTVTDNLGAVYPGTATSFNVTTAPVVVTPPATSGGGGGGATSPLWLLGLALAGLLLGRSRAASVSAAGR